MAKYENGERRLDIVEFIEVDEAIGFDPAESVRALSRQTLDAVSTCDEAIVRSERSRTCSGKHRRPERMTAIRVTARRHRRGHTTFRGLCFFQYGSLTEGWRRTPRTGRRASEPRRRSRSPVGAMDYHGVMLADSHSVVHSDPDISGGTPVFRGTRVPIQSLFDYLEGGETLDQFHRCRRNRRSPR